MARARCDFFIPKQSSKSQLLQAKSNLQRMLVSIPLTDDEQTAVEDGQAALDHLLQRLADIPTPAGTTPRQLTAATSLPIVAVNPRPISTNLTILIPQNHRAGRAQVRLPGDHEPRSDRQGPQALGQPVESSAQRLRTRLPQTTHHKPKLTVRQRVTPLA